MAPIDHVPGNVAQIELTDDQGNVARIAPERGAIVTALRRDGHELLYLDETTLRDPRANVRGGIPVLFPSPGKLEADRWARDARSGTMKQHGFARTLPWQLVTTQPERASAGATVTLRLRATPETLAVYPWAFTFDLTYTLTEGVLRIEQRIRNEAATRMPFGVGFHPYFAVAQSEKNSARIPTNASTLFDNVIKQTKAFQGFALGADEVDAHLLDHADTSASLLLPNAGRSVLLRGSPEFTRWVVWTVRGKDFVCLEPWTSPGNALNTGEGLLELEPGAERTLWLQIDRAVP